MTSEEESISEEDPIQDPSSEKDENIVINDLGESLRKSWRRIKLVVLQKSSSTRQLLFHWILL